MLVAPSILYSRAICASSVILAPLSAFRFSAPVSLMISCRGRSIGAGGGGAALASRGGRSPFASLRAAVSSPFAWVVRVLAPLVPPGWCDLSRGRTIAFWVAGCPDDSSTCSAGSFLAGPRPLLMVLPRNLKAPRHSKFVSIGSGPRLIAAGAALNPVSPAVQRSGCRATRPFPVSVYSTARRYKR